MANLKALEAALNARFRVDSCAAWLAKFEAEGIPAGPIFDILEMHRDSQTLAREMVPPVDHPVAGTVHTIGLPIKFPGTPGNVARASLLFVRPTSAVPAELGSALVELEAMSAAGAASL